MSRKWVARSSSGRRICGGGVLGPSPLLSASSGLGLWRPSVLGGTRHKSHNPPPRPRCLSQPPSNPTGRLSAQRGLWFSGSTSETLRGLVLTAVPHPGQRAETEAPVGGHRGSGGGRPPGRKLSVSVSLPQRSCRPRRRGEPFTSTGHRSAPPTPLCQGQAPLCTTVWGHLWGNHPSTRQGGEGVVLGSDPRLGFQ